MPDGLMFMVPTKILPTGLSPLFSWKTKLRMTQELFHPPRAVDHDESVAAFVERHYGSEMVDRLADPLLSGVYGGEAASLSVRAVLPRFAEMERTHGSLGRAMLAARKKMSAGPRKPAPPLFTSLKNGMQHLAETVVSRLTPASLLTNAPVQAIQRRSREAGSSRRACNPISSIASSSPCPHPPPRRCFAWPVPSFPPNSPPSSTALRSPSASATIAKSASRFRPASDFSCPAAKERSCWPRLSFTTNFRIALPKTAPCCVAFLLAGMRKMSGRSADDQIVGIVRNELQQILGLRAEPLFARVYKWKSAMAQYGVGHLDRLDRIERLRQQLPGLALAGNAYRGIGVPDCIRSGRDAAKQVVET